jgi:serine/alanine adding enzyme
MGNAAALRPLSSSNVASHPEVTTEVSATEWNQFVDSHADATGYHAWEWRDVFARALGHRAHYLAVREAGRVRGILPLTEVRSRLFGRALSSLPYVNYGGVLADSADAARALLEHATVIAKERSLDFIVLRHRSRLFAELQARTHKVTMLLPLEKDSAAMWTALDRKVRNQVRKAEKSNLTTVIGGIELLDDFFRVFARNMRDLGTPTYGRSLFAHILSAFPNCARLHLVRLDGQTIAGAFSFSYRGTIEVPSASSLREHRALCPNHLMYWSIIQHAIETGHSVFDFGRSTPDDGTYQFKEQWGAAPSQLFWEYQLIGGAQLPTEDRHSPKYQAQIAAWKKLPVGVATCLGPLLARAVP